MPTPLDQWLAVTNHLQNIVSYIDQKMLARVSVMTHGGRFDEEDIKQLAIKAPAILVSSLRVKMLSANARLSPGHESKGSDPEIMVQAELTIGISVVAKDIAGLKRDSVALALVQALALILPRQTFETPDITKVGGSVDFRNLFNAKLDKEKSVHLWGGAFKQTIKFPIPADISTVPDELLWSESPEIGADHEGDYQELSEEFGGQA